MKFSNQTDYTRFKLALYLKIAKDDSQQLQQQWLISSAHAQCASVIVGQIENLGRAPLKKPRNLDFFKL